MFLFKNTKKYNYYETFAGDLEFINFKFYILRSFNRCAN